MFERLHEIILSLARNDGQPVARGHHDPERSFAAVVGAVGVDAIVGQVCEIGGHDTAGDKVVHRDGKVNGLRLPAGDATSA